MATPTPSSSTIKGGESRGAHSATTPQSQTLQPTFSSPAPRSVPSPAAHRQAGKSPFAASTQAQSNPSTMAQNHPTGGSTGSVSKAILGSSPAAGMLNFESPMGMGMTFSLSQMGGVGGGVPMAPGMSGLSGLGLMPLAGTSEEERWRRLNEVMEKLKSRPGRVSLENVRALGKRLGFEEMLEQPRTGNSILTFAGRTVMVEMAFSPQNEVTKVDVQFPEPSQALQETAASASGVFYDCLNVPSGKSSITTMLDRFASNLEKLAKIDKPHGSAGDGFNGFEAISGIYSSLHKLYDHERSLAERLFQNSNDAAEKAAVEVTCKKSGRPRMNENGKIGLDLDYWITRRHVRVPRSSEEMLNEHESQDSAASSSEIFSLSVQCEPIQPGHITHPARISDAWISDTIETATEPNEGETHHTLDWLEPPPTMISVSNPGETTEGTAIDQAAGKEPSVRFVAKLRPPLLIPWSIAEQNGVTQDFSFTEIPTYLTPLLLHKDPLEAISHFSAHGEIHSERSILASDSKGAPRVRHASTIKTPGYENSILLHDIPFDHPKQLLHLLPMLRQFAFLNPLLQRSFPAASSPAYMKPRPVREQIDPTNNIDMTMWTSPLPKLAMTFARGTALGTTSDSSTDASLDDFFADDAVSKAGPPISVRVSVLPNAELRVDASNIWGVRKDDGVDERNAQIMRALDVVADLDIWIEYVKGRVAADGV